MLSFNTSYVIAWKQPSCQPIAAYFYLIWMNTRPASIKFFSRLKRLTHATCHAPRATHHCARTIDTRHRMHAHIRTHARTYTPTPHFAACRLLTRAATTIFQFFLLYYINIVTKISCFSNFLIIV